MRDLTTKFGENAGKIWSVLNEEGCLKKKKLLKITQLNDDDFFTGVGWLAKENKISKEDKDCFKLDVSNLDSEIGAHAGRVWKILDIWGDADFTTI
ncbi:MAG: winged helix-turn-helix domain-containing protein, partial [Candidatus Hodarchaeota archaeon]